MVKQNGESFLLPSSCCLSHSAQSLGHAFPALCRDHVRLNDVLRSLRPSLPSLRRKLPFVVRLVHRYYGSVRLLLNVHVRRSVCGLRGPVLIFRPRCPGDLPVLVHLVSQLSRILRLRRTESMPSRLTWLSCCLPPIRNGVGILIHRFFEAQWSGPQIPLSTLQATPHDAACKTRGQDGVAASFPLGLFHPLQHAGLPRRTPTNRLTNN